MKTVVIGDIHGRTCWKDILNKEEGYDKVVFLGDYVSTHDDISEQDQIQNLYEIEKLKWDNPDKVILLRGNHDMQHLGFPWAGCSGLFRKVAIHMQSLGNREDFLDITQWVYVQDNILFSHAGVSNIWLGDGKVEDINYWEPTDRFGFTPSKFSDYTGESNTQPPTWIRPNALIQCALDNYIHVVGHTPVEHICNYVEVYKEECLSWLPKEAIETDKSRYIKNIEDTTTKSKGIWLCDCLPKEYLVIEDNEFIIKTL